MDESFKKIDNAIKKALGYSPYDNPIDDFFAWGHKIEDKLNAPIIFKKKKKEVDIPEPVSVDYVDSDAGKESQYE